jgi:hypothetical protein
MSRRCMIVQDTYAPLARALAVGLAGPSGDRMWVTPLSASGNLPATHWITEGVISDEFAALMPLWKVAEDGTLTQVSTGTADAVYAQAQALGVSVTLAQINALFAHCDITTQEPFAAMARKGLQMVQESP